MEAVPRRDGLSYVCIPARRANLSGGVGRLCGSGACPGVLLYQRGRLMRCDVQRALYWLSWAADHGDVEAALASERLQRAISSGSMERDLAILRGIQELRRRFPMKEGRV